jgi:hypothetical protein
VLMGRAIGSVAFVTVGLAASLVACTLLTPLDGLDDGTSDDAGREGAGGSEAGDEASDASGAADRVADAADPGDAPSASELYSSAVLADIPRAYWRLEETGGTTAKDETSRYGGTYVQTPSLGQPGVAGSLAMKLPNGAHARMSAPGADFRFPGNLPYSVELWVKPGVIRDFAIMSSTEISPNVDGRAGWTVVADGQGLVRFEVWIPNDGGFLTARAVTLSGTSITMGAFHHLVAVYTGTDMLGYVDGVLGNVIAMGGQAPNMGGSLLWGCRADVSFCLDDWTLDELAIYDHELPAARVKAHYDLGK